MKVNIIILNYNSSEETIGLFNNLVEELGDSLQILVVDNASTKNDREHLKKNIPEENIIFNSKNSGYAGGNNIGIKKALKEGADYVWILNPDIRINKGTLPLLLEVLEKDKKLAAIAPRLIKRENTEIIFSDGEKLVKDKTCHTYHKNHNRLISKTPGSLDYKVDYLDGSCFLIRREALESTGLFSEEYFLYFEETDWCYRAKKLGWKIAAYSNANAFNLTSEKTGVFHYYMMRNRMIFSRKFLSSYRSIRNYHLKLMLNEMGGRLRGTYLKPYFVSRLKGLISGIVYTFRN